MQRRISLIPQPQQLTAADGDLDLASLGAIASDPELRSLAWLLSDLLDRGTGLRLPVVDHAEGPVLRLRLDTPAPERPADLTTAAEAYRLDVTADGVDLVAAHPAGISRGIATLRQLLPPDALRDAPAADPIVPLVAIRDEPRLRWRGVMLDVVRHFQPKDFVLKMIDRAWMHRLNVVHLHLTDDQGWRFDVPSRPGLAETASWRAETKVGHARDESAGYEPTPHGGFFSVPDLREIASYARVRHIMIVPEVNLPGHARAVLAAYPELGAGQNEPVCPTFGVFEEVLEPTQASLDFALEAYTAIGEVFEGPFVHIGGDEVPMTQWESSPIARELMEREGIADVRGVQAWFTKAFCDHLTGMGKRVIGWDEILDGGAPQEAVVHVWRNEAYVKKAIAAGHQVVASPEPYCYYDHYESDGPDEPLRIHGHTPVEKVAGWDPVPPGTDESKVLGIQCQLWAEYMPSPKDVEYAAFPRLSVLAEVGWTNLEVREANPVLDRLGDHLERLHAMGIGYRPLEGPKPWQRGGTGRRKRFDREFVEHPAE
ncbi:beta-N-acetylhexosaminidase [Glycomyces harbinensis]|uniref:beta-N-acetylhexosaminidase n=1 Tax=Glycomyces harbinensis TaxID=58114 RepID=A0A1G6YQ23_9ACTN|nr:beta-N-acetylhexosaminidase [Glycomyces harbinensis]SDD91745.1 hexosaminidase [Glycomyces harbinensis]